MKLENTTVPDENLLEWASDSHLAKIYSVSRATIWRWTHEGRLPQPVKLGPNVTRWNLAKVREILEGAKR